MPIISSHIKKCPTRFPNTQYTLYPSQYTPRFYNWHHSIHQDFTTDITIHNWAQYTSNKFGMQRIKPFETNITDEPLLQICRSGKANIEGVIDGIADGMWCHRPAKHKKNYYFSPYFGHSVKVRRIGMQLIIFCRNVIYVLVLYHTTTAVRKALTLSRLFYPMSKLFHPIGLSIMGSRKNEVF